MRVSFLIMLLCAVADSAYAQDPLCKRLAVENGMHSNNVYSIVQDKAGYMWIAHNKGLSKYNGSAFLNIRSKEDGISLSNLVATNGAIYCQDFAGNMYAAVDDSLQQKSTMLRKGGYAHNVLLKDSLLVCHSLDSVYAMNIGTKKIRAYAVGEYTKQAHCVYNNRYYFVSRHHVYEFDGSSLKKIITISQDMPDIFFLVPTPIGFFGITKNKPVSVFLINSYGVQQVKTMANVSFVQDVNTIGNEVWLCTATGAFCFDKRMQPLHNSHCFYKDYSISQVVKDNENNYWFSTINKGLLFVPDLQTKLYTYKEEGISALCGYKHNSILVGTNRESILAFDPSTGCFQKIFEGQDKAEIIDILYHSLSNKIVFSGSKTNILAAGRLQSSFNISSKHLILTNSSTIATPFSNGFAFIGMQQHSPQLPFAITTTPTYNKEVIHYNEGFRGRSICYDTVHNKLFCASAKGLLGYSNSALPKEYLYEQQAIKANHLAIAHGKVYVATSNQGLLLIDSNDQVKKVVLNNSTLPSHITKIFTDGYRYLWLYDDKQIFQLDLLLQNSLAYSLGNNSAAGELKVVYANKDNLFLGTTHGVIVLPTSSLHATQKKPMLHVNEVRVNGAPRTVEELNNLKTSENDIQIGLSLLCYKQQEQYAIQYKINNGDWISVNNNMRQLQFNSLSAGNHSLHIRGMHSDGSATANTVLLTISIAAPLYKKWWFWGIMALLMLVGLRYYFAKKLAAQKLSAQLNEEKMMLEKELHKSTLSSIRSQMNPHFLFNALNTIQSYIYTNDKEKAAYYLGRFSELTRKILSMSKQDNISLFEEISILKLYLELEALRFPNKLNYTLHVGNNINKESIQLPPMLIQPYIENAIKHGLLHSKENWNLDISFTKEGTYLKILIDDNGIGRKRSQELQKLKAKSHESFATGANDKRIEILNATKAYPIVLQYHDKVNNAGNACGTAVTIVIPL